jgi:Carboxypeptidase regulatory-like domain
MVFRALVTILALSVIVLWPASADACSCDSPRQPCDALWRADAVFVGHVVSIQTSTAPRSDWGARRVELAVVEGFRGLRSSQTLARVAGRVQLAEWPRPADGPKPVPNVAVTATGEGRTFSASANDRGEFVLTGLPLGTYEVIAKAPAGYDAVPRTLQISDPRGCGTPVLFVRYDGRMTGRVVESRGVGVEGVPLQLGLPEDVGKPEGTVNRMSEPTSVRARSRPAWCRSQRRPALRR